MSISITLPRDTGLCHVPSFELERGGRLELSQVAFEVFGNPDNPVILVQGGISADRYVTDRPGRRGWWSPLVGPGRAIDTRRFCVVGTDSLRGVGDRAITPRDHAHALRHVLRDLRVDRLHRFVGASYGGMVGLCFAAEFPESTNGLIAISAPAAPHPMASAWRAIQRRIAQAGDLALARELAMTTYRSHAEFAARFATPDDVEGYLEARGCAFADAFDTERFVTLSRSLDLHRVDPSRVTVPTLLIGASTDQLVPIEQLRDLRRRIAAPCRLVELDSIYGHDAFLKEHDTIGALLREEVTR